MDALAPTSLAEFSLGARPHLVGPGDTLSINVLGLPDISREVQVDAERNIAVPLAGTLSVIGRTPRELSGVIEERLRSTYVRDPQVTVGFVETVSQAVTVDGEVTKPGIYPVVGPMTLMLAIARAEGASVSRGDAALRHRIAHLQIKPTISLRLAGDFDFRG